MTHISENELALFEKNKDFIIYRVFDYDPDTNAGMVFTIENKEELEQYCNLTPTSYKVKPIK